MAGVCVWPDTECSDGREESHTHRKDVSETKNKDGENNRAGKQRDARTARRVRDE